jgi:hypothetical protein
MARALIALHKHTKAGQWVHLFTFVKDHDLTTDIPLLRHWGLIEEGEAERPDGNPRAGWYIITKAGREFAQGLAQAAKSVFLYDNRLIGKSEDRVDVRQALGKKFDYRELFEAI